MSEAPINRPEDVVVMFVDAWNHRDPDALAALFDTDAEFVNVTGLWWHTRDQIRSAHAYGLTRIFKDSSLRARHQSESVVGRDRGVHARMTLTGQTSVDEITAPRPRSNVMSFVVHQTPAGRRCASAHNTDVVPGSETNIIDDQGRLRSISYRDKH
jgi:uncharacterized protein (TIGR02246 family)